MRILKDVEEQNAIRFMERAGEVAQEAKCLRAKCGTIIVSALGQEIGAGYNAPPRDQEEHRVCEKEWSHTHKPNFDRTCCMHAEWRAILDALKHSPAEVQGATLYFMRVNDAGTLTRAGEPYCTVYSRFALDVGIKEFVLWHDSGITAYETDEYNKLSYENLGKN